MLYNTAILSVLAASTSLISTSVAAPVKARQSPSCPSGTWYHDFESTSGFKGCTSTPEAYNSGPHRYWGNCPAGLGNWYVCANGFTGCTTNSAICDTKSGSPGPVIPPVDPVKPGVCPAGQSYYNCATGFKGCTSDSTVCDPKTVPTVKPTDTCPAGQSYYVCATGFKGCSSDPTVCDPKAKPIVPPTGGTICPAGESWYVCATGFKGCSSDSTVCDPKTVPVVTAGTTCPAGSAYYNCATGFKGCSSDSTVCDPKPVVSEPVKPLVPATGLSAFCPAGTSYVDHESASGFKGCVSASADVYKNAPRTYWGNCPTGLGNWYVCANGFKGCNTNVNVCGLKA